jgi:NTE family protein
MRPIRMLVSHPSVDLASLAREFEPQLPRALRFLVRGLGTKETRDNELLALLMFQNDYLCSLIEIGQRDAESRIDEIAMFLGEPPREHPGTTACAED